MLSCDQKTAVLRKLEEVAKDRKPQAFRVAFDLLVGWSDRGRSGIPSPLDTEAMRLLGETGELAEGIDDYDWKIVVSALMPKYPREIAELLADAITDVESRRFQRSEYAQEIFKLLAKEHPSEAMQAIGHWILDDRRGPIFRIWDFKGLFDSIGLPTVSGWIRTHGDQAAVRVARHLEGPSVGDDGTPRVPELADWLLTEYSGVKDVFREFVMGRHSGEVRVGSAIDRKPEVERSLAPFRHHEKAWIREWAEAEWQEFESEIEWDERHEDEWRRT